MSINKAMSVSNLISASITQMINALYPVGSVYISFNSSMPSILTSGRTWARVTGNYVLKTVTEGIGGVLTAADSTGATTLTVSQIPSHTHGFVNYFATSGSDSTRRCAGVVGSDSSSYATTATGGGKSHVHTAGMPANVSVYMWKRTA